MNNYVIQTEQGISISRVADLVCCALEGGSNYWCERFEPTKYPDGCVWGHETVAHGVPFVINEHDGSWVTVKNSPERIRATLQLMADKHPGHWADFVNENEDADTGDVFFQLLVFGEVIYG